MFSPFEPKYYIIFVDFRVYVDVTTTTIIIIPIITVITYHDQSSDYCSRTTTFELSHTARRYTRCIVLYYVFLATSYFYFLYFYLFLNVINAHGCSTVFFGRNGRGKRCSIRLFFLFSPIRSQTAEQKTKITT